MNYLGAHISALTCYAVDHTDNVFGDAKNQLLKFANIYVGEVAYISLVWPILFVVHTIPINISMSST